MVVRGTRYETVLKRGIHSEQHQQEYRIAFNILYPFRIELFEIFNAIRWEL